MDHINLIILFHGSYVYFKINDSKQLIQVYLDISNDILMIRFTYGKLYMKFVKLKRFLYE